MFSPGILKTSLPRIDDKNFKFQGFQLACPHTVQFHLWCATGEVFTIKEEYTFAVKQNIEFNSKGMYIYACISRFI